MKKKGLDIRHHMLSTGALFAMAGASVSGWSGAAAMAEEARSLQLEEIVVTAQKRAEGLQEVPISIGVVTGGAIESMGVRNLEELATNMPNFHINQSPTQSAIYIRSIGSGSNNQGFEQSVGLFIDGIYAGRERLFQAPFLDVERVEVLKGPQNVILGKNTTAGAVNITTRQPTDVFEGSLSGLYGEDGEYAVTGIVSGPVHETLKVRVAGRASGMNGYLRNTYNGNKEPDVNDWVLRGTALWQPNENIDITLKGEMSRSRTDGMAVVASRLTPGQLALAQMFDPNLSLDLNDKQRSTDSAAILTGSEYNDVDAHVVALTINWDISDWVLTSISGWAGYDFEQGTDTDFTAITPAAIGLVTGSDYEQLSHELRLMSPVGQALEFMGGLYYQDSDINFQDWIPCVNFASVPGPGLPASFCAPARWVQNQETLSSFARLTWHITEDLRTTAGLRYTHEKKIASNTLRITELDGITPNANPFDLAVAFGFFGWVPHATPEVTRKENSWSPSVNLQYDVVEDVMLYASFAKGTKSGGFNPLEGAGNLALFEYEEEKARSFEFGTKARLFNGRAALNLAMFFSRFTDLQVSQFNGSTFIVTNAASAKVDGVEGDITVRVTEELTLSGWGAYLDSRYGEFTGAPCMQGQTPAQGCVGGFQDLSGVRLPFAPKWTFALAMDYERSIGGGLKGSLHADMNYLGAQSIGPANDPRTRQEEYAKINVRVGIGDEDDVWELAFIGKNLTDKITKGFENNIPGYPGAFFAHVMRGRSFAVQGTVNF